MNENSRLIKSKIPQRAARLIATAFMGLVWPVSAAVSVQDLRCEYMPEALGIDTTIPRFSWRIVDDAQTRGQKQTGYRILVAGSLDKINAGTGDLWDASATTEQSVNVEYAGTPLSSGQICYWKVQVKDKDGATAPWSQPSRFSIGLLSAADWNGAASVTCKAATTSDWAWFRKNFSISAIPDEACMYVGTDCRHQLFVNGQKVGTADLANVSKVGYRVLYNTYDIKPLLRTGANTIGVWVGNGFGFPYSMDKVPAFIGKLEMKQPSGVTRIVTDNTWKTSVSCVRNYGYNAQKYIPGWSTPEFSDGSWTNAAVGGLSYQKLSPDLAPPNRPTDTIYPVSVSGNTFDFGSHQIFTGWVEIKLKNGTPGASVTISTSARANSATYTYTFDSSGAGTFRNWFDYTGINTVTVTGLNYTLALADCRGYRVGNDFLGGGSFDCSNSLLKKEYDISINTFRNLTVTGISMDCLQEREGYGGDGLTHLEADLINYEMGSFYTKWAQDWRDVQGTNGSLPNVAPINWNGAWGGPAYQQFVVLMPWEVFLKYGDMRILRKNYQAMKNWLSFLGTCVDGNGLLSSSYFGEGFFLGDWGSDDGGENAVTMYNNFVYVWNMRWVSKIASILGNTAEGQSYASKANSVAAAINTRFFNSTTNTYVDSRMVDMALPLLAGVVPAANVQAVKNNLQAAITTKKHSDAGELGSYFLFKCLTEMDRNDLAYTIASEKTSPGWGYRALQGYSCWGGEDWDFSRDDMHATFTGINAWFQQGLAGIRADSANPGFKQFLIKPSAAGDLTSASGQVLSMYGKIVSNWSVSNGAMTLNVTIPVNSSALVYYPNADTSRIYEGATKATKAVGVTFQKTENNGSVFLVQSGAYRFSNGPSGAAGCRSVNARAARLMAHVNTAGGALMVRNPFGSPARIVVQDISGRTVACEAAVLSHEWIAMGDVGRAAASGIYRIRAESNGQVLARTMMVVR